MGFAEDKVYDYIIKNLKNFKNIRVASLADSLTCLTDDDRDELHAREETRGSHATVYRFYQHLKCREGWVPDLIDALRHSNAGHLADELQSVYDSWQPRPPAPAAASVRPAASDACPAVSSVGAQMPSLGPNPALGVPLAEHACQELPIGGHPPLLPTTATSTSTDLDARAPVQESLPKNLQQESPRPPPSGSAVCDGVSDGHGGSGHLPHSSKAAEVAAGTPGGGSVAVPSPDPPERGRDWLSRQQHPVCVDNGYFGNANHLHRGATGLALGRPLPPRSMGTARSPEQPRNEPEENFYISTELPPKLEEAACSKGPQVLDSPPKKQAMPSSACSDPPGNFADVRSPRLIQQQFDAEQKLQEHGGDGDTRTEMITPVTTPAPRDASPSFDTSMKPPVQETKLSIGVMSSSSPSMPTKEKVLPAPVDSLLTPSGGSEGTAGRTASRVSSATSVWMFCSNAERDAELSKPGVLHSTTEESPEVAGRHPSSQGPNGPYPGASSSLTISSDPLMVSTDSSSSGETHSRVSLRHPAPASHEDPRGEKASEASNTSHLPSSLESTSVGTHEVHVDHYPSTQLEAGSNLQDGAVPLGNSPDFDSSRSHDAATSSSQAKDPPGDSNESSLPYIVTAVAVAVISVAAFLVYARLRK
ncbi:MAVS protein, partial [Crotophaga sulcirostris]|nr:MAVS protein [Crotophaga sulcirostris]